MLNGFVLFFFSFYISLCINAVRYQKAKSENNPLVNLDVPNISESPTLLANSESHTQGVLPFIERDNEEVSDVLVSSGITGDESIKDAFFYYVLNFSDFIVAQPLHTSVQSVMQNRGCLRSFPSSIKPNLEHFSITQGMSDMQYDVEKRKALGQRKFQETCPNFNELLNPQLDHWENAQSSDWIIMSVLGVPRFIYGGPVRDTSNEVLVAKFKGCFPAKYEAQIRLMERSEAGIAFRIPLDSIDHYFAATVSSKTEIHDSSRPYISLHYIENGKIKQNLLRKDNVLVGSERINRLTVLDYGKNNSVQVLLDNVHVFSTTLPSSPPQFARSGIFLASGTAAVSEISFTNL